MSKLLDEKNSFKHIPFSQKLCNALLIFDLLCLAFYSALYTNIGYAYGVFNSLSFTVWVGVFLVMYYTLIDLEIIKRS